MSLAIPMAQLPAHVRAQLVTKPTVPKRAAGRKKPKAPKLTSEHTEQALLFAWASVAIAQYPALALLHAVPNFARIDPKWGAYMKREGKRAGVPDVHLPVPSGSCASLYIEMKMPGKKPTPEQLTWHQRLKAAGNAVRVCYTWEEAKTVIIAYLRGTLS